MSFLTAVQVTDGTTIAAVKAASTAAVATDPAIVVAVSPNNAIPVSGAVVPVNSQTWLTGVAGTNAQITVTGYDAVAITFNGSGTITTGNAAFEVSDDSGTTWYPILAKRTDSFSNGTTAPLATGLLSYQVNVAGFTTFRVRNSVTITGASGQSIVRVQATSSSFVSSVAVGQVTASSLNCTASIAAAQKIEVYDGTNTATVKAASVAALASDTALVVTAPGSTTSGACANTAVTNASSAILASNVARREAVIVNTDVVAIYIGLGQTPTATAYHVVLKACAVAHDGTGGSFVTDVWKGAINAIAASTTGHVAVTELT